MKQILYDMGPLTLARWPLYRALKVCTTHWTRIQAGEGPPTQKLKKSMCLKIIILFYFVENWTSLNPSPPLVKNYTFFLNPSPQHV